MKQEKPKQDTPIEQDEILLREADEALRQERLINIWNQYGNMILGTCLAIILATGAGSALKSWNMTRSQENTDLVIALQDDTASVDVNDVAQPQRQFALIIAGAKAYAAGDKTQAHELFTQLEKDAKNPVNEGLAQWMSARSSDAEPAARLEQLDAILADPEHGFAALAALDAATIAGEEMQDKAKARQYIADAIRLGKENLQILSLATQLEPLYAE